MIICLHHQQNFTFVYILSAVLSGEIYNMIFQGWLQILLHQEDGSLETGATGDHLPRFVWVGLDKIYSAQKPVIIFLSPALTKSCETQSVLACLSLYFVEF